MCSSTLRSVNTKNQSPFSLFRIVKSFLELYSHSKIIFVLGHYNTFSTLLPITCYDNMKCIIGLIVMAFGPSFSYCLIRLLYGQKWSDGEASKALQLYCLYIVLLAMNGKITCHPFVFTHIFFVFVFNIIDRSDCYYYMVPFTVTNFNWCL